MDHTSPLFEPEVEIGLSAMILLEMEYIPNGFDSHNLWACGGEI